MASVNSGNFRKATRSWIDNASLSFPRVLQATSINPDNVMFYGPGGPYALFAGRDASRALALMSFEPTDLTGNTEGLSSSELETLQDWEYKFMEKYVKVGQIVSGGKAEEPGNGEKAEENQEQLKTEATVLQQDSSSVAADTEAKN